MASSPWKNSFPFFLLFLLSTSAVVNGQTINLRVYFHELYGETSFLVASLNNSASTFGDVRVYDNALTEGLELSSELIMGRGQGIAVDDSLGVRAILVGINFVFSAGEFTGSSLAVYGMSTASLEVNDHAIVGGTGQFRMARGYALSQIVTYNETYVLLQWDFYVDQH